MFQFSESIMIAAPARAIREVLADVETWWPPSNPEHIRIEIRSSGRPIGVGTDVAFDERVAGIKGHAAGVITQWIPNERASWERAAARTPVANWST